MQEITNEVYLNCVRTATEIVSELSIEQVNSSINHFDEDTKRAILSQKLAKDMFDEIGNMKPKEDG